MTKAPGLEKMMDEIPEVDEQVSGARPTSGKHYARMHSGIRRRPMDGKPSQDPENSDVAKNYEKTKKVETLMNRLAEYMAGEIPEDNIKDLITGDDEEPRHSLSQKTIPLASLEPKEVFRHPSQNELEPMMLAASDDEAGRGQNLGDDDNDGEIEVENEADYLPDINVKPIPLG